MLARTNMFANRNMSTHVELRTVSMYFASSCYHAARCTAAMDLPPPTGLTHVICYVIIVIRCFIIEHSSFILYLTLVVAVRGGGGWFTVCVVLNPYAAN